MVIFACTAASFTSLAIMGEFHWDWWSTGIIFSGVALIFHKLLSTFGDYNVTQREFPKCGLCGEAVFLTEESHLLVHPQLSNCPLAKVWFTEEQWLKVISPCGELERIKRTINTPELVDFAGRKKFVADFLQEWDEYKFLHPHPDFTEFMDRFTAHLRRTIK